MSGAKGAGGAVRVQRKFKIYVTQYNFPQKKYNYSGHRPGPPLLLLRLPDQVGRDQAEHRGDAGMRGALQGEEGGGQGAEGVSEKGYLKKQLLLHKNNKNILFPKKKKPERMVAKEKAREKAARGSIWTRTLRTAARRSAPYLT